MNNRKRIGNIDNLLIKISNPFNIRFRTLFLIHRADIMNQMIAQPTKML